jgi:hypothetical protein
MSEPARKDLAHVQGAQVVTADAGSLMAVISRAASDPNTDVDKLERLMGSTSGSPTGPQNKPSTRP